MSERDRWSLLFLALSCSACATSADPTTAPATVPRERVAAFDARHAGVCWVAAGAVTAEHLAPVLELGAGWISQTPFGWMRAADEPRVGLVTAGGYWGERDVGLVETNRLAREAGLRSALKPHVWVRGSWSGAVRMSSEEDWSTWFSEYERFLLHYARLAERESIDLLVIGTELRGTTRERERDWRALIARVRESYGGAITYAANWDEVRQVPFWDALDAIGVNAYFPLTTGPTTVRNLVKAWEPTRRELERLSRSAGRPVLFTEAGYRTSSDCAERPWEHEGDAPDPICQANAWEALLRVFWNEPWFAGVHAWKWFPEPAGGEPRRSSFSPQGRPAEEVLARWFDSAGGVGAERPAAPRRRAPRK